MELHACADTFIFTYAHLYAHKYAFKHTNTYKHTQASVSSQALRLKGGSWAENLKNALFPIEGWEVPKFLSMSCMMFMIIYVYTTVRDTKDTLVVSACGAESITFLKVCCSLFQ